MKTFELKYYFMGKEHRCTMLGDSENDIRQQFKRQGYFRDCILTFVNCPQETERATMLKAISNVIRQKSFSLN